LFFAANFALFEARNIRVRMVDASGLLLVRRNLPERENLIVIGRRNSRIEQQSP